MLLLPADIVALLSHFAPLFTPRTWRHVPLLIVGAILAPGRRMVSSALRAIGLGQTPSFQTYHRILNRAVWSSLDASRVLFGLLVATFAGTGPLVVGIDETIERRRGRKISAAGIYRDPVRSSRSHFVKVRGLRWICAMLLVPIPWAGRVWALPFLTVLAPSERSASGRRRYKPLTTWARQIIRQIHRWAPERRLVVVGDRTYAALELLNTVRPVATVVARLRLDARLFAPPPVRRPGRIGRPRLVGDRLPNLTQHAVDEQATWIRCTIDRWYGERDRPIEALSQTAVWYSTGFPPVPIRWVLIRDPLRKFATQALLCTDLEANPQQIVTWFILRWQLEVTFHEVRAHLGVETQRQWSHRAILRTTPALMGLHSVVTLMAHEPMLAASPLPALRQTAWYAKTTPTFGDAVALVRRRLWTHLRFPTSPGTVDPAKVPRALLEHLTDLLCYAA
jgi:DDE superfamily endonuclease